MQYTNREIEEAEKEMQDAMAVGDEVTYNGERFDVVAIKGEYATIEETAPEDGEPMRKRVKLENLEKE